MSMEFNVGVTHRSRPHLLADLAELILVVKYDGTDELSKVRLESLVKEIPSSAEEIDEEESESEAAGQYAEELAECHLEDCWAQLEYRQAVFDDFYPFVVEGDILRWKPGTIATSSKLYIFLLICARLRSFPRGVRQMAARRFVDVSSEAMRQLVGSGCIVRIFDANSQDRRDHYSTDLRTALNILADQLAAHSVHQATIDGVSSSGDEGLDLVAVRNFADTASGSYAIFGQCAARETEWPDKTLEAHPINFEGFFTLLNKPENAVFIPVCYRKADGKWVDSSKVCGCLLLDRLRILKLIKSEMEKIPGIVASYCDPLLTQIIGCAA